MFLNISLPHTTYMLNMLQLLNPLTQWMRGTGIHTILKFYDTATCSQNSLTLNLQLDNNLQNTVLYVVDTIYFPKILVATLVHLPSSNIN